MQVFLSYSWANEHAADEIEKLCQRVGIRLIRDKYELEYGHSIPEFAERINESDFVICLISDAYIKSDRCMYEAKVLMGDQHYKDKTCCITVPPIYTKAEDRIEYINHWETKISNLENKTKGLRKKLIKSTLSEIKTFKQIENIIDEFLFYVDNDKYVTIDAIYQNGLSEFLSTVISKMGFLPNAHIEVLSDISESNELHTQEDQLKKYSQEHGENEYYYYVRANIYERNNYTDLAVYYYKKSLALNPKYILAYEAIANLLLSTDEPNYKEISSCLSLIHKLDPSSSCLIRLKGVLCIKQKRFAEAIDYLNAYIEKRPSDYAVYNTLAMALEKVGGTDNINKAKENYEKAISLNPNYYQAYNNLAIWYLIYDKNYEKCIQSCDNCLSQFPAYYYSYNVKGLTQIYQGKYDEAAKNLLTSLLLSPPEHPLPINNIGFLIEKGYSDYDVAQLFYEYSMQKNDSGAYLNMARIHLQYKSEYTEAIKVAEDGLKINNNILLKFSQALAYYQLNNHSLCIKICNECIEMDSLYWPPYFILLYLSSNPKEMFSSFKEEIKTAIKSEFNNQNIPFNEESYDEFYKFVLHHFNEFSNHQVNRHVYIRIKNLDGLKENDEEIL